MFINQREAPRLDGLLVVGLLILLWLAVSGAMVTAYLHPVPPAVSSCQGRCRTPDLPGSNS